MEYKAIEAAHKIKQALSEWKRKKLTVKNYALYFSLIKRINFLIAFWQKNYIR